MSQVAEIKSHVQNHEEHHPWLANYLVVKRICTQPNFHDLYLELVKQLEVIRANIGSDTFGSADVDKNAQCVSKPCVIKSLR